MLVQGKKSLIPGKLFYMATKCRSGDSNENNLCGNGERGGDPDRLNESYEKKRGLLLGFIHFIRLFICGFCIFIARGLDGLFISQVGHRNRHRAGAQHATFPFPVVGAGTWKIAEAVLGFDDHGGKTGKNRETQSAIKSINQSTIKSALNNSNLVLKPR